MRARYYVASLGRFASPDTLVENLLHPQSLNRYSYVKNNPLKYIDPSGHLIEGENGEWDLNETIAIKKMNLDKLWISIWRYKYKKDYPESYLSEKVDASTLTISDRGVEILKNFEGTGNFALYDNDGGKNCTIGYGHKVHSGACDCDAIYDIEIGDESIHVKYNVPNSITPEQAEALLYQDLENNIMSIRNNVKVPISQEQFDALLIFAHNTGDGRLYSGTELIVAINEGKEDEAYEFMRSIVYTTLENGVKKPLEALVRRREQEVVLYQYGVYP